MQRLFKRMPEHQGIKNWWFGYALECFWHFAAAEEGLSTQQWADMCAWFGLPEGDAFWMRIGWLASQQYVIDSSIFFFFLLRIILVRWFYARRSTANSVELAARYLDVPGSWLFRFSTSEKGGFAFTVAEKSGKVTHYRVSHEWSGEYVLRMKPDERRYATLSALLKGACDELGLTQPICSSGTPSIVLALSLSALEIFRLPDLVQQFASDLDVSDTGW